jgi:phage/plasmid-associated DNA primase
MRSAHVLKALVGGDTLEGEVKHGNESFSIEGRYNSIISTNTRLRVKLDSDAGAWRRRMLIVDYNRPKTAKPIPGFDLLLLREEGEGILRWAVEGAIALQHELDSTGMIQLTDAQRRRVDDLLSESDSVRSFVRECLVPCHGAEVAIHELMAAYRDFCDSKDWEALRDRQFQAELPDAMLEYHRAPRRNDIRRDGKNARGFRGVRLQFPSDGVSEAPVLASGLSVSNAPLCIPEFLPRMYAGPEPVVETHPCAEKASICASNTAPMLEVAESETDEAPDAWLYGP